MEIAKRMSAHLEIIGTMRFISYTSRLLVPLRMCATNLPAKGKIKGLEALLSINHSPNRVSTEMCQKFTIWLGNQV